MFSTTREVARYNQEADRILWSVGRTRHRVRAWVGAFGEAEGDRMVLWLPVLFAVGITIYFSALVEPPAWVAFVLVAVPTLVAVVFRRYRLLSGIGMAVALVGLGFTVAQLRTHTLDTVTMTRAAWTMVDGRVEAVERRPTDARLTLGGVRFHDTGYDGPVPTRVRVTLLSRDPMLPAIGDRVRVRARLRPPPGPTAPGAFDFQWYAYFQGIGAVGFMVGGAEMLDPRPASVARTAVEMVDRSRASIAGRLRENLAGSTGAVAAAMLVGDRAGLDGATLEGLRASGLAHLLAISGLHMGLVAGTVFVVLRLVLAALPAVALRFPIKKWAAVAALFAAAVYLVLAGAPVPTQRAFVMTGAVLVAVLLDREAISLRLVGIAAFGVLVVAPESLMGPSFQMSFAAVVALVAVYEAIGAWRRRRWRDGAPGAVHVILIYIGGVGLTSLVATVATAPFVAYHFQQVATVGVIANLVAVPLTAFVTMPAGVAALVLMPVGLEAWPLALMGIGIDGTLAVAEAVMRHTSGALSTVPLPSAGLAVMTLGGAWLAIWRTRQRAFGLIGVAIGGVLWALSPVPDALVDGRGRLTAVRLSGGEWAVSSTRGAGFVRQSWARRWGIEDTERFETAAACDSLGCVFDVAGRRLAGPTSPEAAIEDCARADVVITPVRLRLPCNGPAVVVDGATLRRHGAHAIYLRGTSPRVSSVTARRGIRPWTDGNEDLAR